MTNLSPAAQAVMIAAKSSLDWEAGYLPNAVAAAVLRAVAEQIMPITPEPRGTKPTAAWHRWNVTGALRLNLLTIAAELEAHQ